MADTLAGFVRRHDPDRFLTALFAPAARREALFALYAFNHELARAREVASEPPLALIRLHWWREVVEGADRRHEVATPLRAAIEANALDPADLRALIDAREVEAEPGIPTVVAWLAYLRATAGGLAVAAGRLLGAPDPERLRDPGAAYGAAGVLRAAPALARHGRTLLPVELARRPDASQLLAKEGLALADTSALRLPRGAVAAALPVVLARRDLRRVGQPAGPRGLGDRLAVIAAGLRGRA
jgi:phytoene synthase